MRGFAATPIFINFLKGRVVRSSWNAIRLHDKIDLQADLLKIL